MYQATRAIYDELTKDKNLKVFKDENEKQSYVWVQFKAEGGGSYRINFISTDDDNDVAVRVFSLINVNDSQKPKMITALNELNCQFRYVKFSCDSDGDVNLQYDFPVSCKDPASCCRELIIRINDIIEKSYPEIMRAMWS